MKELTLHVLHSSESGVGRGGGACSQAQEGQGWHDGRGDLRNFRNEDCSNTGRGVLISLAKSLRADPLQWLLPLTGDAQVCRPRFPAFSYFLFILTVCPVPISPIELLSWRFIQFK